MAATEAQMSPPGDTAPGTILEQARDKWKVQWSNKDQPSHKGIAAKSLQAVIVDHPRLLSGNKL